MQKKKTEIVTTRMTPADKRALCQRARAAGMTVTGYEVSWSDARKHITFTCPNGRKCRDSSLHDETFLKQNLEALLLYRQATGFRPTTPEPDEGWMGELAAGWFRVAAGLERDDEQ